MALQIISRLICDTRDHCVHQYERRREGDVNYLDVGSTQCILTLIAGEESRDIHGRADAHLSSMLWASADQRVGLDIVPGAEWSM